MSDIVQRLRERAYAFKAPDPLLEEAADEIERLRLTDAEREAVEDAIRRLWGFDCAATLRSLLDRLT